MDLGSIIGLVGCIALVFYGIVGSNGMSALGSFIDRDSVIITIGGTLMCILAMNTIPSFLAGLKSITQDMKLEGSDSGAVI